MRLAVALTLVLGLQHPLRLPKYCRCWDVIGCGCRVELRRVAPHCGCDIWPVRIPDPPRPRPVRVYCPGGPR